MLGQKDKNTNVQNSKCVILINNKADIELKIHVIQQKHRSIAKRTATNRSKTWNEKSNKELKQLPRLPKTVFPTAGAGMAMWVMKLQV